MHVNIIEESREACEEKAASIIMLKLQEIVRQKKKAVFGVPGGRSVAGVFTKLLEKDIPWQQVHIVMVDERCVSPNNPESNYKLVYDAFLHYLITKEKIPQENIHAFIYDKSKPEESLKKYKKTFKEQGGKFDLILLSSGEDGHVAALFPNHESIKNEAIEFIMLKDSPKPPKERMTSSRKLLQTAEASIIVFFGKEKDTAFANFNNPALSVKDCPAKLVLLIPQTYVLHVK